MQVFGFEDEASLNNISREIICEKLRLMVFIINFDKEARYEEFILVQFYCKRNQRNNLHQRVHCSQTVFFE